MVRIEFLGPINHEAVDMEAGTLEELARKLQSNSEIAKWLKNSAVAVNDVMVKDMDYPLKEGDRISILPPVCGG